MRAGFISVFNAPGYHPAAEALEIWQFEKGADFVAKAGYERCHGPGGGFFRTNAKR
jgi:hypothetical protein